MPIAEISQYLARYVRTIFRSEAGRQTEFLGSGFLVIEKERVFLVTASHVMDGFSERTPLLFDNGVDKPLCLLQGNEYTVRSRKGGMDAAIVELSAASNIAVSRELCLGLMDLDVTASCDTAGGCLVVGCPETMNRKSIDRATTAISPNLYTLFTPEADESKYRQLSIDSEDHIVLHWNQKAAYSPEQQKRAGPNLNGLSGAPIWGPEESFPRVLGILTEHHQREVKAIVGVRASAIGAAISALTTQ